MSTLETVISDVKTEAQGIIKSALATNPNLSQASATIAVMRAVDSLLAHCGLLGEMAEPFVNLYIQVDIPSVYAQVVRDALGTADGNAVITGQEG